MSRQSQVPSLRKEVGGWTKVSFPVWDEGWVETRREGVMRAEEVFVFPRPAWVGYVDGFWGWLAGDELKAGGNRWRLHFMGVVPISPISKLAGEEPFQQTEWGAVNLPQAWDGKLYRQLVDCAVRPSVLIGEFGGFRGGYWMVGCQPCRGPVLPRLGPGKPGASRGKEMVALGVLLGSFTGGKSDIFDEPVHLALAWGNPQGELLGWELFENMSQVHSLDFEKERKYRTLGEWSDLEREIRKGAWGREL